MDSNLLLALVIDVLLLLAAVLGRRFFSPGWQRNTLSVVAVVLGLLAAFLVFFDAGLFMRGLHQSDNSEPPSHRALASAVPMGDERSSSWLPPAAMPLAA